MITIMLVIYLAALSLAAPREGLRRPRKRLVAGVTTSETLDATYLTANSESTFTMAFRRSVKHTCAVGHVW